MREENKEKPTFKHGPVVSLNKPEVFERLAVRIVTETFWKVYAKEPKH